MKLRKLVIILIIFILISTFAIFMMLNSIQKSNNKENNNNNNNTMNFTPNNIIELLSYVPFSFVDIGGQDGYSGKLVIAKDVLPVILSPSVIDDSINEYNNEFEKKIKQYNIGYSNVYLTSNLNSFLSKKYNLKLDNIQNVSRVRIIKLDDKYTAINIEYKSQFSLIFKMPLSVIDAYANEYEAIITEQALFYEYNDNKYYVYKNTNVNNKENIIKIYNDIDENGKKLSNNDIFNKIKEDFKDYNYGFKHTYKKNDTGYYWYSTEYVEINKNEK